MPWAREDHALVLAGAFVHSSEISQSFIPDLAFGLTPLGGKVELVAVADIPEEHTEAIEVLKREGAPYSESSYSREIPKGSGIPFSRSWKESVTSPILVASVHNKGLLESMFAIYSSRLYAWDFLLLGSHLDATRWRHVLEQLVTQKDIEVPRQLIDENMYLMITAQEHGAYLISNKLPRSRIEEVCGLTCKERGFELVVKDH